MRDVSRATMCSTLPGEANTRSCAAYCLQSKHTYNICQHCTCAACPRCAQRKLAHVTLGSRVLADEQYHASTHAVAELRRRFLDARGVVLRIWECSLAGCLGSGDDPNGNAFLEQCVLREMCTQRACATRSKALGRPASYLRWDVPAAIFAGGRCTSPSEFEAHLYPPPHTNESALQDADGWRREGFSGHNVTQAGVGWILDPPQLLREAAFAHDAWTLASRISGTHDGLRLSSCHGFHSINAASYAKKRLTAFRAGRQGPRAPFHRLGSAAQRVAAAYKWHFANTSQNCWHWRWDDALAQQRRYALLVTRRMQANASEMPAQPECSIWGSLYNQVHVGWNASFLRAIFYVNDTHTAQRISSSKEQLNLLQHSMAAADRARTIAMLAQRIVAKHWRLELPIVQYTFTDECYRADALMARLNLKDRSNPDEGMGSDERVAPALRRRQNLGAAQATARAIFRRVA